MLVLSAIYLMLPGGIKSHKTKDVCTVSFIHTNREVNFSKNPSLWMSFPKALTKSVVMGQASSLVLIRNVMYLPIGSTGTGST